MKKRSFPAGTGKAVGFLIFVGIIIFLTIIDVLPASQLLGHIKTLLIFGVTLSILVSIHEFGHFIAAVLIGVKVEEFGFGLPPLAKTLAHIPLKGYKFALTLNWLPIGGFVRMAGEDDSTDSIDELRKKYKGKQVSQFFWARSKKERAVILLAGVTMNFLLAVGITAYLLTRGIDEPAPRVKIESVMPNSPAEIAGIKAGDSIKYVEYTNEQGQTKRADTRIPDELIAVTASNLGKPITLVFLRQGEETRTTVTPRVKSPEGEGAMGVKIDFDVQTLKYEWYQTPWPALKLTLTRGRDMIVGLASLPSKALQGQSIKNDVAGPIGIAKVTGQAARISFDTLLNLVSILSLSLAFFNVLPLPALDGGRLLFVILEKIMGKPVDSSWERKIHQYGMMFLLGLIALVTLNDIARIFLG